MDVKDTNIAGASPRSPLTVSAPTTADIPPLSSRKRVTRKVFSRQRKPRKQSRFANVKVVLSPKKRTRSKKKRIIEHQSHCEACHKRSGSKRNCSQCTRAYHVSCLEGQELMPDIDWKCPECVKNGVSYKCTECLDFTSKVYSSYIRHKASCKGRFPQVTSQLIHEFCSRYQHCSNETLADQLLWWKDLLGPKYFAAPIREVR